MRKTPKAINLAVSLALGMGGVLLPYQSGAAVVTDAVQDAIRNNPEVLIKLHQLREAGYDVDVGRADYFPTVDVNYEANRQRFSNPDQPGTQVDQHYTTRGWTANLTQNLFRGLQTWYTTKQLGYDQQSRYFDFLDNSESIALQTVQAYQDVLRYRKLVDIARDNYAVHKGIYDQIAQKVQAGAGRRVDLEQANGRLALAETNLITDTSNLHDVTARYVRLTGKQPPEQLSDLPDWKSDLPANNDLIKNAVGHAPAYLSTLYGVRSAQALVKARRGAFSPTVDLQASTGDQNNYLGFSGHTKLSSVAVIFNMNLSRGGADRARLGAAAEKLNQAQDLRDKVCRDMRQTLSIADNNIRKLQSQMESLRQHQISTEKARDAYRKQFDIGQRTLLDVLDSENELFDAQRAYINAQADHKVAQATVLGSSGRLLEALKLKPVEDFKVDQSLSPEESSACDTAYSIPEPVDVSKIPSQAYVAATASPVSSATVQPDNVPAAPAVKSGKSSKKAVKPAKPATSAPAN